MEKINVALLGNPNSGKSVLFNTLTGASQQTGNWAGKTVEPFTAHTFYNDKQIAFTDLPGVYGFSPTSREESKVMDYLSDSQPDVIIVVIDALHMERNLYLAIEAIEHFQRVIVVVSKTDHFGQQGYFFKREVLEQNLGVPVFTSASGQGFATNELMKAIVEMAEQDHSSLCFYVDYPESTRTKLAGNRGTRGKILKQIEAENEDSQLEIIQIRYNAAAQLFKRCTRKKEVKVSWQDKLDSYVLHPLFAVPLMGVVFGILFFLTFVLCRPFSEYIGVGFDLLGEGLDQVFSMWGVPHVLNSLLINGLLKGIGATVSFTPQLAVFFFIYGILQDSGYLVRVAFITDRMMSLLGLNGKTFLPLVVGCTCNVNGVIAARILTSKYDRIVSMLASTYVPCSARVGVIVFLASAFFGVVGSTIVMLLLLLLCVLLMAATAFVVKFFVKPEADSMFFMEMPSYQKPNFSLLIRHTFWQTLRFLGRIKTVIIYASFLMWALSSFPEGPFENSYIAQFGKILSPFGAIIGLNWQLIVALLFGIAAKETALTSLGIMYHAIDDKTSLANVLTNNIDPLQAFIFLMVYMIYLPCAPTLMTMFNETGKWRIAVFSVVNNLFFAVLLSVLIYNIGRLFL